MGIEYIQTNQMCGRVRTSGVAKTTTICGKRGDNVVYIDGVKIYLCAKHRREQLEK